MQKAIKYMLKQNELTIRGIARKFHVNKDTLSYDLRKPYTQWKFQVVRIMATATHNTIKQFILNMEHGGWYLNINNKEQSIQDITIPNLTAFLDLREATIDSYFEGWQPNSKQIAIGVYKYMHPDKADLKESKKFKEEMRNNK